MTRARASVVGPALVVGAGTVALLCALVSIAVWSADGQIADERAMRTVTIGREAELTVLSVLGRVPMWTVVVVAVVGLLLAVRRHDARAALGAGVVVLGANATTQLTKHSLLERSDFGLGVHNSLPSGHVTLVVSAVAALLIVAPPAARAVVAGLGAFAAGLTGLSTIVAGWHRPADVVAALLVVMAWCAVGVVIHGGRRGRGTRGTLTLALGGALASLVAIVLIGVRPVDGRMDGFLDAGLVLGTVALASAIAMWVMAWLCPRGTVRQP
ncbi:phosphatase PAP2 family protein [Aeromicrobium sp.]|uniref:phosphatase PAP2 family protein n=1 Tax=Aeromicrobium sp. TaxID=1871063 RepID=UPI0028AA5B13|nr:phosphatase PAP2 family protein [Aeromicrobium sp.]